ncbi:hypothetical protein B0H13DRAFT_1983273 [Mycena leptocephala]|nr:hypothetical protein B0H13DRAFT_1983273 [Mycena leptocephala]
MSSAFLAPVFAAPGMRIRGLTVPNDAVARNVVGPALPQARDEAAGPQASKAKKNGKPTTPHNPMAPAERVQLQKNAETVKKLEGIFSFRHKDRTSKANKLTGLESHRFARAMYRVMLLLEKIEEARHAMLSEYPTPQLLEIRAAVAFLHELIGEVLDEDDFDRLKDICIATGPTVILRAHGTRRSDVFEEALEVEVMSSGEDNALFSGFFSTPLERILEDRDVEPPESAMDAILDGVIVHSDACAQCGVVSELWNEANWENLISVDFCALLQGKLNENEVEAEALVELCMSPKGSPDVVVAEIYDMLTPEFAAWKKDESVCSGCLDKLIGAHLHLWLYKRKIADGWKATQNCWYGYNCKTQVQKSTMPRTKTFHLCTPIR